ncbi:substrate-binding domain-containing protein [Eubacteriales bacterium OttesenSCG-928-N14]|nr:substrate-binding domain-containing protein [Eubacteriales bacterium OttesenSCG-928-N14]
MKKILSIAVCALLAVGMLAGCGKPQGGNDGDNGSDTGAAIAVVSREEGSGTRGAFVELMGIEQKDADGKKVDHTTQEAITINSTNVMINTVKGNKDAIGYISLGSMNSDVKALQVDGVDATVANIKSGSYKVARPFNIATKTEVSAQVQDFIDYIMSADGQKIIEDNGYISVAENAQPYAGKGASGKIVIAGSSSVTPVMEKLKEGYLASNPDVSIEIQQSDSSIGMQQTIDGICDIGMASRELKDSETAEGIAPKVIAMDGIAVIVNKDNAVSALSSEQIRDIFTGKITTWGDVK